MTVHVHEPEPPAPPRRSGLVVRLVSLLVGLALVGLLVWELGPVGSGKTDRRTGGAAPATGGTGGDAGGLEQGTASAGFDSATRKVSGVPRGFPHTVDGAVEAYAASIGTFVMGMATMSEQELDAFVGDFMQSSLDFTPLARDKRAMLGLDSAPGGESVYSACPAGLGAYKVQKRSPVAVSVSYWGPCIYGPGSPDDRSGLHVVWQWSSATMRWSDGDWRMPATAKPVPAKAPAPADLNRPDTRFAERAKLLGAGWKLFEGASQAWPTRLLGEEP